MKIKAAVLYELNKPLVIEELETQALGQGQVLVKVLYSGVCQTQLNEVKGLKGPDKYLPHTLGHEASGIVEEAGPGVTRVRPGDYVVLSWIKGPGLEASSSQYKSCSDRIVQSAAADLYLHGRQKINSGAITTFSTFSVVSENRITKIPGNVPPDVAALLGCAVPTGAGMVKNTLKAVPGSSIAVFGLGSVGLSAVMFASMAGCAKIIAVDILDSKLELAKKVGATHVINSLNDNPLEKVRAITGSGADYAVESSGVREVMELAFEAVRLGGTAVLAGNIRSGEKIAIDPYALVSGKKIVGTWGGETRTDVDIPFYAGLYLQGRLRVDMLITHRYGLEDINAAFAEIRTGAVGKALIKLGEKPDEA